MKINFFFRENVVLIPFHTSQNINLTLAAVSFIFGS